MKKQTFRTILFIAIGFIGGLAVVGPLYFAADSPQAELLTAKQAKNGKTLGVTVAIVRQDMVLDGIRSVGTLLPNEEVDLSAEISGKVSEILFTDGQRVKKGQVLVKINDEDLQAKRQRYEYQEKMVKEKLERQRVLLYREAVSQEAFDLVETEYNVLRADIDLLDVNIKRSTVRAPFDGLIGLRHISEGAYVQPSTRIARLVDNSQLLVEFSIPEKYISKSLVGEKIFFTVEGNPKRHQARIYAIEPKIDEATRTIILRARFNNSAGQIRPGMSARITIPTSTEATRLLIPSQTIVPTMSGKSVWVVVDGRATERVVATGARLESDVEVLSGLEVGDSVIVNGIMQVSEGMPVAVK